MNKKNYLSFQEQRSIDIAPQNIDRDAIFKELRAQAEVYKMYTK